MDGGSGRLARITYHTGTRTFERLFKEKSLAETKEAIRRKLELSDDADIRLRQVRGSITLDLEDDDDFDALRSLAYTVPVIEVEVVVVYPTPSTSTLKRRQLSFGQAGEPAPKKLKPVIPPSAASATDPALPKESMTPSVNQNTAKKSKATKKTKAAHSEVTSSLSSPLTENATEPPPPTEKRTKKSKKAAPSLPQPRSPVDTIDVAADTKTSAMEQLDPVAIEDGDKPKKRQKSKKKLRDETEPSSEPANKAKRNGAGEQTNPRLGQEGTDESESSKFPAAPEVPKHKDASKKRRRSEVGNDAAETPEAPSKPNARKRAKTIVGGGDVSGELAPTQSALVSSPRGEAAADAIASRIAEKLVRLVSSRDNGKGSTAPTHLKSRQASKRTGTSDISPGEVSREPSQSASVNHARQSESIPASPSPAPKALKKRRKKASPAREPPCPICRARPLHSSPECPVVTAGEDSIQERLTEPKADNSRDHATLIEDLEEHLRKLAPLAKNTPVRSPDSIAIPPRMAMSFPAASVASSPWTPSIAQGACIQEVPVQGQGEGSSSESSDDESEPDEEPPQRPSQLFAGLGLHTLAADADLNFIMRGPPTQRSALQDIPSKTPSPSRSDRESNTPSEPEEDDDDDRVKAHRPSGRGRRVDASSDEEQGEEEDDSLDAGRMPITNPPIVGIAKQVMGSFKERTRAEEESIRSDTSDNTDGENHGSHLEDSAEDTAVERSSADDVENILNTSVPSPDKEYSPDAAVEPAAVDQMCAESLADDKDHWDDEDADKEPKEQKEVSSEREDVDTQCIAIATFAGAPLLEEWPAPEEPEEEAQDDREETPVRSGEEASGEMEGAQPEEEEEAPEEKAVDGKEYDPIETEEHGEVPASQLDPIEDLPPTQIKPAPPSRPSLSSSLSRLTQRLKTRSGKIPDESYEYPILASQLLPPDPATPKVVPSTRMTHSQRTAKQVAASPRRTRASSRSQAARSSRGAKSSLPVKAMTHQSSQPQSLTKWETMAEPEPSSPSVHHDELRSSSEARASSHEGRPNSHSVFSQDSVPPHSQTNGTNTQGHRGVEDSDSEAEGSKTPRVHPVKLRPKPPLGPYRRLSELARSPPSFSAFFPSTPLMATSEPIQSTLRRTAWENEDDSSSDDDSDGSEEGTSHIPASKKAGAKLKTKAKRGRGLRSFA